MRLFHTYAARMISSPPSVILPWVCLGVSHSGLAHLVPRKHVSACASLVPVSSQPEMSRRTGLEAEAINRLTEGVQPSQIRAILVQCLAGEVAPSAAIARMLAEEGPVTVRAAIDGVTHRAATISRASDMLVHDRVDELTQIFVENVAPIADVPEVPATKSEPVARPLGFGRRKEDRTSGSSPA
jgi:hypothetical protein